MTNAYRPDGSFAPSAGYAPVQVRTDGVLTRRFMAYFIDLLMLVPLLFLFSVAIAVFGLVTFGLGWGLYAILIPGTFLLYNAVTVGGFRQGTIGMRMMDLVVVDNNTGGPVGGLVAAIHAFLFYMSAGTLILVVDIVIGLARPDRRLLHDILTGVLVMRRS